MSECREIKCTGCGGIAEFVKTSDKNKSGKCRGYIHCPKCGKQSREYSEKYAAVKAWYREVVPGVMGMDELINKINYQLNIRDWNYDKLAWVSGVPLTTLMNIMEGNTKNPGIFTIMRMCKAFGITVDELLGESDGTEKLIEQIHKIFTDEIGEVSNDVPDGGAYPKEALRMFTLNKKICKLIRESVT